MLATWHPSAEQQRSYDQHGYFVVRNTIPRDLAIEIRGVIRNHVLTPDVAVASDNVDPMDPMGDSPAARQARLRKLTNFCQQSPLIWHSVHGSAAVLAVARHFLGDDLLLKFDSCFLKPALSGSATPWHQDNGLWRDDETQPFNFWMAIDPATRANGCMQFVPGSHHEPIHTHVMYDPKAIHGEIPRETVEQQIARRGLHHIELDSGDMVCWHSNLFHYSPPNTSPHSRIAVAGVFSTPALAAANPRFKNYTWCLRAGQVCQAFPPESHIAPGQPIPAPPYPLVGLAQPAAVA